MNVSILWTFTCASSLFSRLCKVLFIFLSVPDVLSTRKIMSHLSALFFHLLAECMTSRNNCPTFAFLRESLRIAGQDSAENEDFHASRLLIHFRSIRLCNVVFDLIDVLDSIVLWDQNDKKKRLFCKLVWCSERLRSGVFSELTFPATNNVLECRITLKLFHLFSFSMSLRQVTFVYGQFTCYLINHDTVS